MLASDILPDSAALLNDSGQITWSNTVLLPYLKKAYDELIKEYELHGLPVLNEVSSAVTVTAGTKVISSITDIVYPKKLEERASGSSDLYLPMTETTWEPDIDLTDELRFWTWREGEIKLVGATSSREVRVYYMKTLSSLTAVSSTIAIPEGKLFLVARTAAIAAALSGGNFERAAALEQDAQQQLDRLLPTKVKSTQGGAIRHRGYRR